MPKSKRDKKVSLTKTSKKGLVLKQKIVEDVRSCVEKFPGIYVFHTENMRTDKMNEVRAEWKPSRFFFGKNKVISIGLGRTSEEEVDDDLHKLSGCLKGQCGLLFTDKPKDHVINWFSDFAFEDYPRSGCIANRTVEVPKGPVKQFSHAMEPYLRQLGLPTSLDKGVVTLIKDYVVCKKNAVLTPEQAKILKLFEIKMAVFKLHLKGMWVKGEGYKPIKAVHDVAMESDDNDDDE